MLLTTTPYDRPLMEAEPSSQRVEPSDVLLDGLRGEGMDRHAALDQLHAMLIRGAHHELNRRREQTSGLSREEIDDLANQAADDAMAAILVKLDTFRGESRFTTWAYKFVILEAGVKARRRAWRDREVTVDHEEWEAIGDGNQSLEKTVETSALLEAISEKVKTDLTPYQREVFTGLAVNEIPIDVLAERLATTRGALYKTLHDARRKLRASLEDAGYDIEDHKGGE